MRSGCIPDDEQAGRDPGVVLTDGFWQSHFARDPEIVGRSVLVDGRPVTVVGVLPKDFYFLVRDTAVFFPMTVDADFQTQRTTHSVVVLARLAPGVTQNEAQSEIERLSRNLAQAYPATNDGWSAGLAPVFPLNKHLRSALLMLLGAVGCVLLIACINVGNLLLAKANAPARTKRSHGLGASKSRLIRQMLAESLLLAGSGTVTGVPLAAGIVRAVSPFLPDVKIAGSAGVTSDACVLLATLAFTIITTVFVGVMPALKARRTEQLRVSADSHRRATAGTVLLTIEVALSFMLFFAAILLVRSLWNLERLDPGFRADHLTTMQVWLPEAKYADRGRVSRFYEQLLQSVQDTHDVSAVAVVNTRPFLGWSIGARLQVPGHAAASDDDPIVDLRVISPGYFAALRARLISGRNLDNDDGPGTLPVALINTTMARHFWSARRSVKASTSISSARQTRRPGGPSMRAMRSRSSASLVISPRAGWEIRCDP
jgi:predicted permease